MENTAKERTLTDLLRLDDKVYVRLETEELRQAFRRQAAAEGFTLYGRSPLVAEVQIDDVMVVTGKRAIRAISGFNEGMAYLHEERFAPRVDYGRYISGNEDFFLVLRTETRLVPVKAPRYVRSETVWS